MKKPQVPIMSAVRNQQASPAAAGAAPYASTGTRHARAVLQTETAADATDGQLSVDVVFATDTPVRSYDYHNSTYYDEVLSMAPAQIRFERINSTGSVLDSHNTYGSVRSTVLGSVVPGSARVENGVCRATLRISSREDLKALRQDIRDGHVKNISVGYNIYEYTVTERTNSNQVPVYLATDWEASEISFVSVPADIASGIRGAAPTPPENLFSIPMKYGTRAAAPQFDAGTGTSEQGGATPPAANNNPEGQGQRATPPVTPTPAPDPETGQRAATAERTRAAEIRAAVRAFNLPESFADGLVADGSTIDASRAAIQTRFASGDPTHTIGGANGSATVSAAGQRMQHFQRDASAAILMRAGRSGLLSTEERAHASVLGSMSLLRMAEHSVTMAGGSVSGMSQREIVATAFGMNQRAAAGMATTSDFPLLLGTVINRTLRAAYDAAPQTFEQWATRGTLTDFRTTTRVSMSGLVQEFDKVAEGGEYKYGNTIETGESIKLGKYGKIIPISWEAIINDDLGAFNRIPNAVAQKARQLHGNLVYGLLLDNPVMMDTHNLFSAEHNNLAAAGGAINVANMAAAYKAFRTQKAPGETIANLNLTPKFLIVGPEQEQFALQFLNGQYVPTKQADINIYQKMITLIVDSRVTGNQWFLASDPGMMETVEYAFLSGEPDLFTEEKWGFEVDGYQLKARTVFGTAAIEFRGLYKNPGQ